jgi:hypothetical protein
LSQDSPALDEAFELMAASGFELPNGFVNHGPMACEALAALDCDNEITDWARRIAAAGGTGVDPVSPESFRWQDAIGDYHRLPEWIGWFEKSIAVEGWPSVIGVWIQRLLPGLAVALFHGAIRTAHAVRAIGAADTQPRQAELARALAYWAARFHPGQPAQTRADEDDLGAAVARAAADGASRYLIRPNILYLHGVTGAMAVELFLDHIPAAAGAAGLAQIRAEHAALYREAAPAAEVVVAGATDAALAQAAAASRDPHQVKLVEACRRGLAATGDRVFSAAAETVTSLG